MADLVDNDYCIKRLLGEKIRKSEQSLLCIMKSDAFCQSAAIMIYMFS